MNLIRAKKHLGQHFLTDKHIAEKIVNSLRPEGRYQHVLEVGAGMGILSDLLLLNTKYRTYFIDVDADACAFLQKKYPQLRNQMIHDDILKINFKDFFPGAFAIIGNFPYNISAQILFKVLENKQQVVEVVGMFQKEVAERCMAQAQSKQHGILSIFLQAYYHIEYLFTVQAAVFRPVPKVLSSVIRLSRNGIEQLGCNEKLFQLVVKSGFNQRRKTLRNALSVLIKKEKMPDTPVLNLRAEQLSIPDFINLTNQIDKCQ